MNNDIIFFKEVVFLDLNKKVAFVTGASIGLGKGLIEELSKNGCNVIIGYNKSKEKAEWLKKYIEEKYNVKSLSM
jgi:short-subunit dehydrogenase